MTNIDMDKIYKVANKEINSLKIAHRLKKSAESSAPEDRESRMEYSNTIYNNAVKKLESVLIKGNMKNSDIIKVRENLENMFANDKSGLNKFI